MRYNYGFGASDTLMQRIMSMKINYHAFTSTNTTAVLSASYLLLLTLLMTSLNDLDTSVPD